MIAFMTTDRRARDRARENAHRKVSEAMKRGTLARLPDGRPCVDCGAIAVLWEHRDYSRPLDVEPVCASCNNRRGPGLGSASLGRTAARTHDHLSDRARLAKLSALAEIRPLSREENRDLERLLKAARGEVP